MHNSEESEVVVVQCSRLKGLKEKNLQRKIFVYFLLYYFMGKIGY